MWEGQDDLAAVDVAGSLCPAWTGAGGGGGGAGTPCVLPAISDLYLAYVQF